MIFEIGDKVICINDNDSTNIYPNGKKPSVELNKIYTICKKNEIGGGFIYSFTEIIGHRYSEEGFISLLEFRKMKINKIKDGIQNRRQSSLYQ